MAPPSPSPPQFRRSLSSPPQRASTSCATRPRSSARYKRTSAPSALSWSASIALRFPRTQPCPSSTSTCATSPRATRLHPLALANAPVSTTKPSNPTSPEPRDAPTFDLVVEERLLRDIVDEALAQGVWITRVRQLRGLEVFEVRSSIRLAAIASLSRKECERTAGAVKAAAVKVLTKRSTKLTRSEEFTRSIHIELTW